MIGIELVKDRTTKEPFDKAGVLVYQKAFRKGLAWIPAGHILRMSPPIVMDEKTLLGSYSASTAIQPEVEELVLGGYRKGFDLTQLISHRFPLEEAVKAIEVASHPQADSMKIMIEDVPGGRSD